MRVPAKTPSLSPGKLGPPGFSASGGRRRGSRDRTRQEGASGLRLRRHRDRPVQAHARPGRRGHRLEARRPPARAAAPRLRDGRRRLAAHRGRDRQARRARRPEPRGDLLRYADADAQLERVAKFSPSEATRGMQKIYAKPVEPELIGAARPRDQGRRRPRRLRAHPAAGRGVLPDRPRGRARRPRHPGDGRLGRARLRERRRAQPEGVHREPRHPRGRRRLRVLPLARCT